MQVSLIRSSSNVSPTSVALSFQVAGGLWKADCRRDREVGQGGQIRRPSSIVGGLCFRSGRDEPALPDVPAVAEFIPGYEASAWSGIGAPRNTPTNIIETLNRAIKAGLSDPKIKAQITDLGGTVFESSPAEFSRLIAEETEKWSKVIRAGNIKPE